MGKYWVFESAISDILVQLQQFFFSNENVAEIMKIDRNTVNQHTKRGKIPEEYFEKYLDAWEKADKKPQIVHIRTANGKKLQISFKTVNNNTWNVIKNKIIKGEKGKEGKKDKKGLKDLPLLVIKFVEALSHPDPFSVRDMFYKNDKNRYPDVYSMLNKYDALDGKSMRFPYLIGECFTAFSTLTLRDLVFFRLIFCSNQSEREAVLQEIATAKISAPNEIISILSCEDGKNWLNTYKLYTTDTIKFNKKKSVRNYWYDCASKIKQWIKDHSFLSLYKTGREQEAAYTVCPLIFLELIWPKDGADDTEFGAEEIKALITFKYFLTEEARQELIDKFQKGQPKE